MSSQDPFENLLRQQNARPVPEEWRAEILQRAKAVLAREQQPVLLSKRCFGWKAALINLFWPHPRAWVALGIVWVVIAAFHLAGREPHPTVLAAQPVEVSPQVRALLREQERMLAEMIGDQPVSRDRNDVPPGPRSKRKDDLFFV